MSPFHKKVCKKSCGNFEVMTKRN